MFFKSKLSLLVGISVISGATGVGGGVYHKEIANFISPFFDFLRSKEREKEKTFKDFDDKSDTKQQMLDKNFKESSQKNKENLQLHNFESSPPIISVVPVAPENDLKVPDKENFPSEGKLPDEKNNLKINISVKKDPGKNSLDVCSGISASFSNQC